MEIWLDTINLELVEKAAKMGVLHGVTTNPSILAKAAPHPLDALQMLLEVQKGPVTCQVVADEAKKMIEQGEMLYSISERIIVKIPVTKSGLEAIRYLHSYQIKTMATVVYHPRQALLASLAGAEYIALYFSRIQDAGQDALNTARQMLNLPSKILAASLRTVEQIEQLSEINIDAITLKDPLFEAFTADHPLTLENIKSFQQEWRINSNLT